MKIVAIGGGNNSKVKKTGEPKIYEHDLINKEIIKLSGKKKPHVLYISHAMDIEYEERSFNAFKDIFLNMYSCPVKLFSINDLLYSEKTNELLNWAHVIYVGGGNTRRLLELWNNSGLDKKMIELANSDKVLCGTSAGGGCWFKYMCSDYLQMEKGDITQPLMPVEGLGLVNLIFNPHCADHGRMKGIKNLTELFGISGVSLTDNMAIEIVDNEYKLVKGTSSEGLATEGIISYWKDGKYNIEPLEENGLLSDLTKEKTYQKTKKVGSK